jgi:hypothetical protein
VGSYRPAVEYGRRARGGGTAASQLGADRNAKCGVGRWTAAPCSPRVEYGRRARGAATATATAASQLGVDRIASQLGVDLNAVDRTRGFGVVESRVFDKTAGREMGRGFGALVGGDFCFFETNTHALSNWKICYCT